MFFLESWKKIRKNEHNREKHTMEEANADEEEEDQGGGGENEEEEEEEEESIVSETKTEEEVVIKKDPPFWHLSFCSDAEIRDLQHRDETNNGNDFEKEKDEMIGNEPLFQTLADLMVMALSLQEVVRQLEFFEGENMSECTTQPRITLADVLEICDEAVQVGYRQAKARRCYEGRITRRINNQTCTRYINRYGINQILTTRFTSSSWIRNGLKGKMCLKYSRRGRKRKGIVTRGIRCVKKCFIGEVGFLSS